VLLFYDLNIIVNVEQLSRCVLRASLRPASNF